MALDHPEPRFRQDCVVVEYVAAHRLPGRVVLDSATWTLEVALGRLIQRTRPRSSRPAAPTHGNRPSTDGAERRRRRPDG
jgi:hypothetical protein